MILVSFSFSLLHHNITPQTHLCWGSPLSLFCHVAKCFRLPQETRADEGCQQLIEHHGNKEHKINQGFSFLCCVQSLSGNESGLCWDSDADPDLGLLSSSLTALVDDNILGLYLTEVLVDDSLPRQATRAS